MVRKKDEGHTRRALAPRERGTTGLVWEDGLEGQRVGKGSFLEGRLSRRDWLQAIQERLAGEEHGTLAGVWHENGEATASLT